MTAKPAAARGAVLYTPAILGLAMELANYPLTDSVALRGVARSRVCGSHIEIGLATDADGIVSAAGARVTACAIGQAAAALFLRSARGQDQSDIAAALDGIQAWLTADDPLPGWPGIAELAPSRNYPARHAAILLPWRAALVALSNRAAAG